MEQFWCEVLSFCQTTTKAIAAPLIEQSGNISPKMKEDGSLVTEGDRWADQAIREAIMAQFPEHGVLTEETTHIFPAQDWCWIVDPIDGTTNFTRGIPIWSISLGLLYRGTPVFGFVYLPQLQQSFYGYWYGETGLTGPTGAYVNGKPIHTSKDTPSKGHLFNLCARSIKILQKPFPCKIRMIGVASYNILLVACGAALGGVEATPKVWDIAAVWVIIQAAGGVLISLKDESIFPLTIGRNYGRYSFPCLVVSQAEFVPLFKPLVECIL
ncbi:inositol monophosphatase family protein [Crocosphaera sp. UHCC 0190]|uniref:inositol monophosphatase family protein n=1 Tax=Crocosphaera sp. UHCC 0190 TaxID=3110246 RepID=UPI002B20A457|nr:inositol monophosphatase family protein [Crocosphaera sp. UHCC 0190]MEA5508931.1 inositol monophosphatase family protein [Crocosphaera sp. UHCC 0190]